MSKPENAARTAGFYAQIELHADNRRMVTY